MLSHHLVRSLAAAVALVALGCSSAPSPDPATPGNGAQNGAENGAQNGAPQAAEAPAAWLAFAPKDGSFSAQFPGAPEESVEPTDGPTGKVDMHQFAVERPTGSAYMASYTDFPVPPGTAEENKQRLLAIEKAALESARATLIGEKEIAVNGIAGREYVAKMAVPEEVTTYTRVFLRGSRLFQFMALLPSGTSEEADVRRYLDSVALAP